MTETNRDNILSHKLFRSLVCVAALVLLACYLFGEDESDNWVPSGDYASEPDVARRESERSYERQSSVDASARQRRFAQQRQYAQQQYVRQLMIQQALRQRIQQQARRRQSAPSGSTFHRGHDSGTGGDGETFYAIGKGWSYIR